MNEEKNLRSQNLSWKINFTVKNWRSDVYDDTYRLVQMVKEMPVLNERLTFILSFLEPIPKYYDQVERICESLNSFLKSFYKGLVSVKPFGSAVTTLALRDSDIDIFLDFNGKLPESPKDLVKSLRNILKGNKSFRRVIAIEARIPIIQCIHQTGFKCDISFINGLGVANSNLIKFLLTLDVRIKQLILILKYVLRNEELIGSNALTSYALVILVIFFLQQLDKPLIPPLIQLQEIAAEKEMIAGWNTSFTTDKARLPTIENHLSVVELFKKIFEYYATFEFGFYVICPYTAKIYLKPNFINKELLSKEFQCYQDLLKETPTSVFECKKFVCVQDPFNHSHNITRNVTKKVLHQFQNFFKNGLKQSCEESETNDYDFLIKQLAKNISDQKRKKQKQSSDIVIYVEDDAPLNQSYDSLEDLRKSWSEGVLNKIKDILIKIFKCKVKTVSKDNIKFDLLNFEDGEILNLMQCELNYFELVTKKRNEVKTEFQFPSDMAVVNQEEIISDYICDVLIDDSQKISFNFEIICFVKKSPTCICLQLDCKDHKNNKNLAQQVFHFIQVAIPKWIR